MKSVLYGVFLISVSALLTSCSVLEDVWPQNLPVFSEAESSAQAENSASPEEGSSQAEEIPSGQAEESSAQSLWPVGRKGDLWILPDSDTHVYTQEELSSLTAEELRLARNELYARRGRTFSSPELAAYFGEKPWYHPSIRAEDFTDDLFSETERANLVLLQGLEAGQLAAPPLTPEQFPKIDGSTATLPISQALYQLVTGADALEAETAVTHTKTSSSYRNLLSSGSGTDLVIAYEPDSSVREEMEAMGDPLLIKPIGRDALVFMVNRSNPVHSLTGQQLEDIYSSVLTNWKEVGGNDLAIAAFQRPDGSGSQSLMEKLVMKGRPMADAPAEYVVNEMGELLESVASYDNTGAALGYSVYYYARNMYQKPELSFMAVNGVSPSAQTIRDGSYPYVNDFYAAIRRDEPQGSPARILFDWLTSDDGQALINGLGYVGEKNIARRLPAALTGQPSQPSGTLDLPPDTVFLADGEYLYGESGTIVFDSRLEETAFIPRTSCQGLGIFSEWDKDKPLILTDTSISGHGNAGLYSLQTMDWILEPEYDFITEGPPGYLTVSGRPDPDTGAWTYSYSCVDAEGRVRFSGGDEAYDRYQDMCAESLPSTPEAFAGRYPEILAEHHASTDAVSFSYPISSGQDAVACIRSGSTDYYYSLNGEFLMAFDTADRSDASSYFYAEDLGHGAACLRELSSPGTVLYIYHDGVLTKTLTPESGESIIPGSSFYAVIAGNYVDIKNSQGQLCRRFLSGSSRRD